MAPSQDNIEKEYSKDELLMAWQTGGREWRVGKRNKPSRSCSRMSISSNQIPTLDTTFNYKFIRLIHWWVSHFHDSIISQKSHPWWHEVLRVHVCKNHNFSPLFPKRLSRSVKYAHSILIRIALNIYNNFGSMAILTMLVFLIHEQGIS